MKSKLLLLAFSLCAVLCSAQTPVQLLPSPKMQFMDSTGTVPLALGKVCTYQAGTTTPLATYTDSTGTVQNSNPVILDVAGRAQIWWGTAAYKVTLLTAGTDSTCSTGSQVWSIDNVSLGGSASTGTGNVVKATSPTLAGMITDQASANSQDILTLIRFTNTSPQGNFLNFKDSTNTVSEFRVDMSGQITTAVATGNAPFVVASTTPVANLVATPTSYNAAGTQQTNTHIVYGQCVLGTSCAVTFVGSAVFTGAGTYQCTTSDATAAAAVLANQISGSAVTFTGTGTDTVRYICVGN